MKNKIYSILITVLLMSFTSCSNDFLEKNLTSKNTPSSDYTIFVSPDWDAAEYPFNIPNAANEDFEITKFPEWLVLNSTSGTLRDGFGIVNCKAKVNSEFSKIGIYLDKLEVNVAGKTYYVPIAYITEGNPTVDVDRELNLSYASYTQPVFRVQNSGEGILIWDIVQYPEWLTINRDNLDPEGFLLAQAQVYSVPFSINTNIQTDEDFSGKIILRTNDKKNELVEIVVNVSLGNPSFSFNSNSNMIDFGRTETTKTLDFSNHGSGLLAWSIEDIPAWLRISETSGMQLPHNSKTLTLTCNRDLLPDGASEAILVIKTNAKNAPTTKVIVRAREGNNSANTFSIEGVVIDADYDKNSDLLYLALTKPNKLLAIDTKTKSTAFEIMLEKAPTSLAISEDKTVAAVGHGGFISYLNLENKTVVKVFGVDYSVYDITWASTDWLCFTKSGGSFTNPIWLNVQTGGIMESSGLGSGDLDAASFIKKIPNQPYVVGFSSSSVLVYSVITKEKHSRRFQYIGKAWFSDDGEYLFDHNGNVFKTSALIKTSGTSSYYEENINAIAKLIYPEDNYARYNWINHSSNGKSIWAIVKVSYPEVNSPYILKFEDNDYSYMKSFYSDEIHRLNNNDYNVQPEYVFGNSVGNELSVVKLAKTNSTWSVEYVPIY